MGGEIRGREGWKGEREGVEGEKGEWKGEVRCMKYPQ